LKPDRSTSDDDISEQHSADLVGSLVPQTGDAKAEPNRDGAEPGNDRSEPDDDGPPPLQFSLKTLFVLTTLACAAFAVVSRLSMLGAVALVWLLLLMGAHVSGNAWGSRATARSTRRHKPGAEGAGNPGPLACAPQTHLGRQATLGLSMAVMVGVGAVIGSVVGLALIWRHNHGGLEPTGILLGAFSSAVIGAFLSFLACSCLKVSAKAIRQASSHAGKHGNAP
jgi:hypothetical protein